MSGGGGSGSDGGGDMQVSGMEAAVSKEKGIHTHADTRVQSTSFSPGGDGGNVSVDQGGPHYTGPTMGPDYNTGQYSDVGLKTDASGKTTFQANVNRDWSDSEIEKGYTDEGEKLANVNGTYMTKSQMYNTGIIEKDPETGKDVQGRYTINANTGELERTDMSFTDHWKNAPDSIKYSPTLRLLYASGKNIGEWMNKKNFEGYNEAGLKTDKWGFLKGGDSSKFDTGPTGIIGSGDNESRQMMNELAPEAPYIVSGTTQPTNSPAANWYQSLGNTKTSGFAFSFANELKAAKTKQASILGNPSAVGMLAVNDSPFYNWLKTNNLDKGIL